MWRVGLSTLLSHWRRNPGLAVTLIGGLALATALWTGVQAINAEARASYDRAASVVAQEGYPILIARDGGPVALTDYVALRRAGWQVSPVLQGETRLGGVDVTLLGLDPLTAPTLPQAQEDGGAEGTGGGAALAAFIGPPGQLFAAPGTDERLRAQFAGPDAPALILSEDVAPGLLVGDIGTVSRLLDRPDTLSRLVQLPDQQPDLPPLDQIAPELTSSTPPAADTGGLTDSFHLNLTAFGMLSFTVGLFIVHGSIGLAFEQRRGTIRTLRALGLPLGTLTGLILAELAALALIGGLLGVALGYGIAAALLPDVAATLRGLYGAPASGDLALRPGWIAAGLGMALLGTLIAAGQSLWRLRRMPVLASAQPRAWRMASEAGLRRQALVAGALVAASALCAAFASGLVGGFATLGLMLLGAALALPPVLAVALAWLSRSAHRPLAQWFWADSRQQVPALSLALMALMLALAANIGVSTMVGSFRATFIDWLDQRLAAELYVNPGDAATAAAMRPWLEARADAVLPRATTEARLQGRPVSIEGLTDHPTYRSNWPLLAAAPDAWDRWAEGGGVMINEHLSRQAGLAPGDSVDMGGSDTPVLGVYSDYGAPRDGAVMAMPAFTARFGDLPVRFSVRTPPDTVTDLSAGLRQAFTLRDDQIIDQISLKRGALEIFERTFAITRALNALTLGIAAVAILTSLLTLASLRLPQVAPVWALGLTRARLGWLELARAAVLAGLTMLVALPVGLALAWLLLAVINVAAFGWRLPMSVFPGDWVWLAGLALTAALLAAAWPARRLATAPPRILLQVFANER